MIKKTEAIVLRTQKFQETSLLATLYTELFGKKTFIVRGYATSRKKKKHSYFQPMSMIDVVFYNKESRQIQQITETNHAYLYQDLFGNPVKTTLGLLIIEVFNNALKEEGPNPEQYLLIKSVLQSLDKRNDKLIHVFLFFLVSFCKTLGITPSINFLGTPKHLFFDMDNGNINANQGVHSLSAQLLVELLSSDLENCVALQISNPVKKELIREMLDYYKIHLEGFREPTSLKIFEEVFS